LAPEFHRLDAVSVGLVDRAFDALAGLVALSRARIVRGRDRNPAVVLPFAVTTGSEPARQLRQKIVIHHSLGRDEIVAGSRQTWQSAGGCHSQK